MLLLLISQQKIFIYKFILYIYYRRAKIGKKKYKKIKNISIFIATDSPTQNTSAQIKACFGLLFAHFTNILLFVYLLVVIANSR